MTDEEIIKALENCGSVGDCQKCTLNDLGEGIAICIPELTQSAVELINRQKADIERYKGVIKILEKDVKDAKAEAIKDRNVVLGVFSDYKYQEAKVKIVKDFAER